MKDLIRTKLANKKVLLLGFGREGRSSYSLIREVLPQLPLVIADMDENLAADPIVNNDDLITLQLGKDYLEGLEGFDLIMKSPGISLKNLDQNQLKGKITSQTDLFLQRYRDQVVGVTGTKGKSTTASLIHHILKLEERNSLLTGNIGRPAFDCIEEIEENTVIVYELSSHQLEYITNAPHIGLLLNLYKEHLDAYSSYEDYQRAKMNILLFQEETDYFIYNADDSQLTGYIRDFGLVRNYMPFSFETDLVDGAFIKYGWIWYSEEFIPEPLISLTTKRKLKGNHNVMNIMAAINACKLLEIDEMTIKEGVAGFNGLEHRLEYVGFFHQIHFYNDSIATIPEASIEAIKALSGVDTLIVGGFDRGIDYLEFARFLGQSKIRNLIFTGEAGKRIGGLFITYCKEYQKACFINRFDDFLEIAISETIPGAICLLSPAAASYDEFTNFEFRGRRFKELVTGKENRK